MSIRNEERLPADLKAVADELREARHQASAPELERIKTRVLAQRRAPMAFGLLTKGVPMGGASRFGFIHRVRFGATALVLGLVLSAGVALSAVTGQFSGEESSTSAKVVQYRECDEIRDTNRDNERDLRESNRTQEKQLKRSNKKDEKKIDDKRDRKQLKRSNRKQEKGFKRANRREEKELRDDNREEERECREGDD